MLKNKSPGDLNELVIGCALILAAIAGLVLVFILLLRLIMKI